jgi:zinc protease
MPLKYHLDNGMSVVLWENPRSPVVSAQVWVRSGSIDEQRGQEGLSHFIEHLLFKGTEKYGVGQIAQTVEGSGGELNAYTSFDHTVYYVNISSVFAPVAIDVLSQMMGAPLFDPVEIENERGVILEEIKRSEDSASRQASRMLFETNYKKHPYRRPVLGYERVIEKIPVRKIIEFFESRYTPSNMTLVVSGDFEVRPMKAIVAEKFGGLTPRRASRRSKFVEPKQERPRVEVKRSKFQEDMVFAAWKIPGSKHKDAPALDVLSLILGQGESSRLYQRLRLEKSLVKSVGCSAFTPIDQGLLAISLSLIPSESEDAFAEVLEVLSQYFREGASEQEVQKAVLQICADEVYSFETAEGLANKIGMGQFYFDNPEHMKSYLKAISEVRAKDVHRVAKKYMVPEGLSVNALISPDASDLNPALKKFVKGYERAYRGFKLLRSEQKSSKRKLPALKLTASDSKLEVLQLGNGIRLYHLEDNSLPLYSIKIGMRGGSYSEPVQGVSDMMGRMWATESEAYSEAQIHQAMESTSSSLSSFGGRNTNGVTMGGLSTFFEQNLLYLMACLTAPSFPEPL